MKFTYVITAIASALLVVIGMDKFFPFMEPPCSLMTTITPVVWKGLGFLQLVGAILIWLPKLRKYVAVFFLAFMSFFSIYHITQGTFDIGGSVFMSVLMAILIWDPNFTIKRSKSIKSTK